jgi:feruloyl-CoA synthase
MSAEGRTFASPDTAIERRRDGTIVLTSRHQLDGWPDSIPAVLEASAVRHPDRPLAAQRDERDQWIVLTYGEAQRKASSLARAFMDLGLGPERPVMVLSPNSLEHLLVTLGAYVAGVPVMPISVAYSLMSSDHGQIKQIAALTEPGLVFADDADAFAKALDALAPTTTLVARGQRPTARRLDDLISMEATGQTPAITPDTTAKLLFTSGSTGVPKGVINTHQMLCANQAMLQRVWPFLADEPPVLVDWLPWSHTFGGNHNLNLALFNGGTLYIDDGRPAPPLFPRTLAALGTIAPTVYFNVPAGFALLAPALENDRTLAEHFFSRLRFMFYAGAALPEALARRLTAIAHEVADHEVPLTSSWGTTETSPAATSAHFSDAAIGCIGVPLAANVIKLAPVAGKLEIRVRGPNVTPGYYRQPELTTAAFDEEGFYRSGDAVKLVDETDPNQGLLFDGRIAEDFKLMTGTWVAVGPLRMKLLSAAGVLTDAVICGQDREYVTALAWVNQAEATRLFGSDDRLRGHLAVTLTDLNREGGSATRIERLLVLPTPPSLDAGEITDKGYVNQRRCLECRAPEVRRLYACDPDPDLITPCGQAPA